MPHTHITPDMNPEVIQPFYLERGNVGCLLIHGFNGSPQEMRGLGDYLSQRGITVYSPLLPGHGTDVIEFRHTPWSRWSESVYEAYVILQQKCNKIFSIGFSLGGGLALHLAAHHSLAGVATLSTGIIFDDWRFPLIPFLKKIIKYTKRKGGPDVKNPEIKKSVVGYDLTPSETVHQVIKFFNHLRDDLREVRCPILVVHASMDHRVPLRNADEILSRVQSIQKEKVILNNSYHMVTMDNEKEIVNDKVFQFIQRNL